MEMVTPSRIDEKELPSSTNEDLNEIPNVKALLTRLYYECMKTEKNASEYQNKSGEWNSLLYLPVRLRLKKEYTIWKYLSHHKIGQS